VAEGEGDIPSPEQFPPRVSSTTSIVRPSQKDIYEQLTFLKSQPQVTSFSDFIEGPFKVYNMSRVSAFQGGQLSSYYSEWAKLTSDTSILETVLGEKIDFIVTPTASSYPPNSICKEHSLLADAEIKSLLEKRVIRECTHEEGEFISPVFTVPKNDGSVRLIPSD
jgi:hypothetical protein